MEIEKTEIEIQIKEKLIEDRKQKVVLLLQSLQHTQDQSMIEIVLNYSSLSDFLDQIQANEQLQEKLQGSIIKTTRRKGFA